MRGLAGAVVLALVLSVGLAAAQNVTLSRTYFSDSFRLKATGMKAPFTVFVTNRPTGQPESIGITFPAPSLLDLAAAGPWAIQDFFSADVGSPESASIFAQLIGVEYFPKGDAGGGTRDQVNSMLLLNKTQYAAAAAASPWAVEQFAISFNLVPLDALRLIVCDDFPPCTGDLTPFVNFPPPAFVPDFYYPNYLSMAPTKGICWAANQVQTKAVFQEQPALTLSSYNGHVNAWGVKVAVSMLQAQTARNMSCPVVNAGVPNPREFERQGWYPRGYRISYDDTAKTFTIAMTQLQWRQAYKDKLDELARARAECDQVKLALEEVLQQVPEQPVIINNEMAGMVVVREVLPTTP